MHVLPGLGEQVPGHVHDDEQVSTAQTSPLEQARVEPAAQTPPPLHALQAPKGPQSQVAESHVRVRVWVPVPQFPHAWLSVSVSPGVHTPLPPPTHAPQAP